MTINTKTNVLMLTFESIEWDYSQPTDKVVSFVDNTKYQETDARLVKKTNKPRFSRLTSAHSAKSAFSQGICTIYLESIIITYFPTSVFKS